jgi:hypothetical protein
LSARQTRLTIRVLHAQLLKNPATGEEVGDAVLGVGEPLGEAGEEGSEEAAGEGGLTGLFRAGCACGREVFEFEIEEFKWAVDQIGASLAKLSFRKERQGR